MRDQDKLYILEQPLQRFWILEKVKNRPFLMRIQFYSEVTEQYQKLRSVEDLCNSFVAFRNHIMQSDRDTELPIEI